MTHATTLARPYARAVFNQAQAEGTMASWLHLLHVLAAMVEVTESVYLFHCWSAEKKQVLYDVLSSLLPEPLSVTQCAFIDLLVVRSQRWRCIREIYTLLRHMHYSAIGCVEVVVCTAYVLLPPQRVAMQAAVEKYLAQPVEMREVVMPDLIGGVVIHIQDHVIDASVRGRIQHMTQVFFA